MVVVMQTDGQAALSGKLRFIQADSTFGVVAPGGAKEGVAVDAIRSAGKRAFDWDLFNIVAFVQSLNRSVTIFRAMVIGTTADMYEELFEQYFRVAAANGLAAPRISDRESGGGARQQRTPFVSVTMDFETGQHIGCFRALARVFGGQPENYHGRVVGCSVHFKRFLLGPCGNNLDDPFFIHMTRLRESDTDHGIEDVRAELMTTSSACAAQGETRKANIIRWLLQNEPALLAAFPRATGVLGKIELLASYSDTNSRESLNRQTKQVVSEKGASTLLDVVSALSEFDHATMASMTSPGRVVPTGDSQMARMGRAAGRRRRSNAVPATGQPPKPAQRQRRQSPAAASATVPSNRQGSNGLAVAPATATYAGGAALFPASLIAEFQAFLSARARGASGEGGSAGPSAGAIE
ncbi:hypothetical protein I4F81_001149 [Pyropia yezoensis]|uniref:Uncharacterized protein n=1 Tax=Pyropia yezoensis TaxID=2788 RepID=A0ACC3BKU9_PYRYE|nr:hypothetical protein I4F81_001149 [Neopyropia yezoensis]